MIYIIIVIIIVVVIVIIVVISIINIIVTNAIINKRFLLIKHGYYGEGNVCVRSPGHVRSYRPICMYSIK